MNWNIYTAPAPPHQAYQPPLYQYSKERPCPLCRTQRRHLRFCCSSCINSGRFAHSDLRKPDDLGDKEIKMKLLQRQIEQLKDTASRSTERAVRVAELTEKIRSCKQSLKYLRPLVQDKREKVSKVSRMASSLSAQNERRVARLPMFVHKVDQISKCSAQHVGDLDREEVKLSGKESELAGLRRKRADELSRLVFTVEEVSPEESPIEDEKEGGDICEDSLIAHSLADAMQTSYIEGRWVMSASGGGNSSAGEIHYRIVAPTLVGSGDYSTVYHAWKSKENHQVRKRPAARKLFY